MVSSRGRYALRVMADLAENEKNGGDPVIRQNVESILRSAKKLTD